MSRRAELFLPIIDIIKSLACLGLLIFLSPYCKGQCGNPYMIPTTTCEKAPLGCLTNYCYETTNMPTSGATEFCGPNTAIQNAQYFWIIPTQTEIEIQISVNDCSTNASLQSALIGACPWYNPDVIDCDPGTPPGGTMILQASGLVVGQNYWLLIDGFSGATCSYTITYTYGIFEIDITGELSSEETFSSDTVVEQGYDNLTLYTGPPVDGAHGYYWILGWSGDTVTSTEPYIDIDIPCDLDPGLYDICVRAFSGCDTTDTEVCINIEVVEVDGTKTPAIFCPEEFPLIWDDIIISEPGTYTQTFSNGSGCSFDSIWQVDAYPQFPAGQIDTLLCVPIFIYEGQEYTQSGSYMLFYPNLGSNGCDSSTILNLEFHDINMFVEYICMDTQEILSARIAHQHEPADTLTYEWYSCGFETLLSTTKDLYPDSTVCFCLITDNGFCNDTFCSSFIADPCEMNCSLVQDSACTGESLLFHSELVTAPGAEFHWLIDLPGTPEVYFSSSDSLFLTYSDTGWYHANLTVVDSMNTITCVDSFYITTHSSEASLCCTGDRCGTCTELEFTFSGASPWNIYLSNGTTIDTIEGVTSSLYLHVVCPPADSTVTYTLLQVTDRGGICSAVLVGDTSVTITLHSSPNASIIQTGDTLCANPPNMAGYGWYSCPAGTYLSNTECFVPTISGCYCVDVSSVDDCVDTACIDIVVGVNDIGMENEISIYPNPSKEGFNVNFKNATTLSIQWNIYSLYGQLVDHGVLDKNENSVIWKEAIPPGVYLFELNQGDQRFYTKRLIRQ